MARGPRITTKSGGFFTKRFQEIGGLSWWIFALFWMISLLSFNPTDPSLNVSVDAKVQNWGGQLGAYFADPLLQIFGFAAYLPPIVFFAWGYNMLKKQRIFPWWLRLTALVFLLVSASALLGFFMPAVPAVYKTYGGFMGMFLIQKIQPLVGTIAFSIVNGLIFFASLYLTTSLSNKDWKVVLRAMRFAAMWTARMLALAALQLWKFCNFAYKTYRKRRHPELVDDDDEEEDEEAPVIKKSRKPIEVTKRAPRIAAPTQASLDLVTSEDFNLPSINLLGIPSKRARAEISESALEQNARLLEKVLEDFGVYGEITHVRPGPVVTLYELAPAAGTKSSRIIGLADDIARSMSATSARIAIISGKNALGIELPNANRETVYFREMLESAVYTDSEARLPLALGKDISGESIVADLAKMPHLLVAGTTGSGKSVAINTMILSLLYKYTPAQCRLIMVDPKMLELSVYDGIPHLLCPVVTEPPKAIVALKWTVKEMENRYRLMSNLGVRNIANYNTAIEKAVAQGKTLTRTVQTGFDANTGEPTYETQPLDMKPLPLIVVIVDEMADLMLVAGKDIEGSIQRLAQMARAAGIHLIMATQRPSVDVITGVIKANFPTRISFQVTSKIDSRTILGESGAEQLLGMGDMLFMEGGGRITRVHGPFVDDKEVEKVVAYLKQQGAPEYIETVTQDDGESPVAGMAGGEEDDLYRQAVEFVVREGKASTSFIQRAFKIGYNRAANIIDQMEKNGVVGPANHVGKREVLLRKAS